MQELNDLPVDGYSFEDGPLRRGTVALRWTIVASYFALAFLGVLDVSTPWLLVTGAILVAISAYNTIVLLWLEPGEHFLALSRQFDAIITTLVLIALHDIENPIWTFYLLLTVGAAHFASPREIFRYVLLCNTCYAAVAISTAAGGHHVSWGYAIVAELMIFFMGISSTIIAGGEQRVRMVVATAAATDSLTGLPNRRRFQDEFANSIDDAVSKRLPMALMLLDVDRFKEINDAYGHPAGDDKLREVAEALGQTVRRGDLVARYGGDEFVIIAPQATRTDALGLAERLRMAAHACGASLSIGVAVFPEDAQRADALIEAADAALYRAKQAGRNCVRMAAA